MSQPTKKEWPPRQMQFSESHVLLSLMCNLRIAKDKFYLALGREMVSPAI